jgi:hypothetical protein
MQPALLMRRMLLMEVDPETGKTKILRYTCFRMWAAPSIPP